MSAENEEIMCFLQRLDKQLETICGGVRRLQLSAHQQIRKLEPLQFLDLKKKHPSIEQF